MHKNPQENRNVKNLAERIVQESLKEYGKTYELLSAYDKGKKHATKILAKPGPLQKTLQSW